MNAHIFTQADWEHYAVCYDSINTLRPYQDMLDVVSDRILESGSTRILDAACGTGNLAAHITTRSAAQHAVSPEIIGCDSALSMLDRASEKQLDRTTFFRVDLNTPLPFPDNSFTAIASINTLYAVKDPLVTLKEFFRVLDTGVLVLVTPKAGYQNGLILKEHCGSEKPDAYWENIHSGSELEESRIREACGDSGAADDFILVGKFNRLIFQTGRFHFFTEDEIRLLVSDAGFVVREQGLTYAKQCHLIVAST